MKSLILIGLIAISGSVYADFVRSDISTVIEFNRMVKFQERLKFLVDSDDEIEDSALEKIYDESVLYAPARLQTDREKDLNHWKKLILNLRSNKKAADCMFLFLTLKNVYTRDEELIFKRKECACDSLLADFIISMELANR